MAGSRLCKWYGNGFDILQRLFCAARQSLRSKGLRKRQKKKKPQKKKRKLMFHICTECGAIITNRPETLFFLRPPPLPHLHLNWSANAADHDPPCWPALASIFPGGKVRRGGCSGSRFLVGSMRSCSALHTSLVSPICSFALYFAITFHFVAAVARRITSPPAKLRKGWVLVFLFFFKIEPTLREGCHNVTFSLVFCGLWKKKS